MYFCLPLSHYNIYNRQGICSLDDGASSLFPSSSPVPPGMGQGAPMHVPSAQQQQHHQQQQNASFAAIPGLAAAAQMNPMMTDMAMQYGQNMMGKGQEELKKNLDKYVSIGQLKYYFAVDTTYVAKKLGGWDVLKCVCYQPWWHSTSLSLSRRSPLVPVQSLRLVDKVLPG